MAYLVTRNTDSHYSPLEGHRKGSLTIRSKIWFENIFPISRDQQPRNRILGRKYVSGKLFTNRNRLKMCTKVTLGRRFDRNF